MINSGLLSYEQSFMDRIIVIGGGIGGLTTALALTADGFQVDLFEQASGFGEVGAGLQLGPNCSRILHDLGLEKNLKEKSCLPDSILFRHWRSGKQISSITLGENLKKRFKAPYYHIHRADLIELLVDAARERTSINLHNDAVFESCQFHDSSVTANISGNEIEGSLLVGADGLHSAVRSVWQEDHPEFTGYLAWRGVAHRSAVENWHGDFTPSVFLGKGAHFLYYPVRSGELINWVAVTEQGDWTKESWSETGDIEELKEQLQGWHPNILSLLEALKPDDCFKWALYDRPPLTPWLHKRAVLVGDACHPTLPFVAQGAAMAIEDAMVLSQSLKENENINQALLTYQNTRIDRTSKVQKWSRRNGIVYHLGWPFSTMRNLFMPIAGNMISNRLYSYCINQYQH